MKPEIACSLMVAEIEPSASAAVVKRNSASASVVVSAILATLFAPVATILAPETVITKSAIVPSYDIMEMVSVSLSPLIKAAIVALAVSRV